MRTLKIFAVILILLACFLCMTCCAKDTPPESTGVDVVYFTVTFDSNGGSAVPSVKARKDGYAAEPSAPTREGYIFDGWVKNGKEWDFQINKVTEDITLSAKWIDAKSVYAYEPVGDSTKMITELIMDLEALYVPSKINGMTVVSIGDGVFADCPSSSIRKIVLPTTVTSVGKSAFEDCKDIEIVIEGELTSIGDAAFKNCTALTSVPLGEGLLSVSFQAFRGCTALESVRLPKSVTTICETAFEECEALTFIVLYDSLASVVDAAFRNCSNLKYLYFYGSAENAINISVSTNNNAFRSAKHYIYSQSQPQSAGDYWYTDEKGRIKIWK